MKQAIFGTRIDNDAEIKAAHAKVFNARKVAPNLFKKAYAGATSTAAEGGETIPTPLADRFIDLVEKDVFCRQLFRIEPMTSATKEIPIKTALESTFLIGEGVEWLTEAGATGAATAYSRGTWSSLTLTAKKFGNLSGYSSELGDDSLLNFAEVVMAGLARSLAEGEERAFLQGEQAGTTQGFGAGDPRYAFDGLIWHIYGDVGSTGNVWTPDNASPIMWADGGSLKLTAQQLNDMIARLEEAGFRCSDILVRPKVRARMRDSTEFEQLQSMKDIGSQAALVKGFVGRYYTADLITSFFLPEGTSSGYAGTGSEFVTNSDDSMVLGIDRREPIIGDRKRIEIRKRHRFYQDIEEVRVTERVAFDVERPIGIAGINDVKLAA